METLDNPRRLLGDPYLVTKFRGDSICHFKIIAKLIFRWFGLKVPQMAPQTPKMGFLEDMTPKWEAMSTTSQLQLCVILRHLSHTKYKMLLMDQPVGEFSENGV